MVPYIFSENFNVTNEFQRERKQAQLKNTTLDKVISAMYTLYQLSCQSLYSYNSL